MKLSKEVLYKLQELLLVCIELNRPGFSVFYSFRGHINALELHVNVGDNHGVFISKNISKNYKVTYLNKGFDCADIDVIKSLLIELSEKHRNDTEALK